MNLCRLVYFSERNMSVSLDINQLIATCHKNNSKTTLTGMLHYNGNYFIQVIEGSRADVSFTYHRIAQDPRHQNILLIACNDVRERSFPGWSMGLHEGMNDRTKQIFLRYFASDRVDPSQVNVESLLDVLQDLSVEL